MLPTLSILTLWLALLWAPAAQAQTTDELVARTFGTEPADYLFLIDTSQGMLLQAEALREPLAELIAAIPAGDRVGVLAYHTRPSEVLSMQAVAEEGRAALVEKVKALPLSSARETDLGAGLSAAADALGRAGAARVQFLVIISDFCHNPTMQSRYDSGGRGCRPIRDIEELEKHFSLSTREHLLTVQYLSVTREGSAAPLSHAEARRVAGEGQLGNDPAAWMRGYAAERAVRRYGPVAQDWAARLKVEVAPDGPISAADPDVSLLVRVSPPVRLLLQKPALAGGGLRLPEGSPDLTVGDGDAVPLTVPLPVISGAILPRVEERPIPIELSAGLTLQPEVAWKAVGVEPQRPPQRWQATVQASVEAGSLRRLIGVALAGVVMAGLAGALIRQRLNRWPLGGALWWRQGGGPRQEIPLGRAERVGIVLEEADGRGTIRVGPEDKALLVLWRTGKATAMVDVRREGVEINARTVAPGRHAILPAAASFRLGDYRLTWE